MNSEETLFFSICKKIIFWKVIDDTTIKQMFVLNDDYGEIILAWIEKLENKDD